MKAFETENEKLYWIRIKDGKFVYWNGEKEIFYDQMKGKIVSYYLKENEINGQKFEECIFTIICENEKYLLSFRVDSSYFRIFCNYLPNLDMNENILIKVKMDVIQGKKKGAIFVKQLENWIKAFYTRDAMKDYPGPKIITLGDKIIYDNTDQINYWKNYLNTKFKIQSIRNQFIDDDPDDLPF
jgi:hypothetical protein